MLLPALLSVVWVALAAWPSQAAAAPDWSAQVYWGPTNLEPAERGGLRLEVGNVGDERAEGWPTVEIDLPAGVSFDENDSQDGFGWSCTAAGSPEAVTCANPGADSAPALWPQPHSYVAPGFPVYLQMTLDVAAGAPLGLHQLVVTLSGGGAPEATVLRRQIRIAAEQPGFGLREGSLGAEILDEAGNPYHEAGGRPFETVVSVAPTTRFNDPAVTGEWGEMVEPVANPKDLVVDLPAGFVGNPRTVPACTKQLVAERSCSPSTQIGVAEINQFAVPQLQMQAIYNVAPSRGAVAEFMLMSVGGGPILLRPVLRGDGDWGLSLQTRDLTEANPLFGFQVRLWGVPADPRHDHLRCELPSHVGQRCAGYTAGGESIDPVDLTLPHFSAADPAPFLTNPTACGPPGAIALHESSWLDPAPFAPDGDPDLSSPDWVGATAAIADLTGCESLEFEPTLRARPTTDAAGAPTGFEIDLHVPQSDDPNGQASSHLRRAVLTLPEGLVANPAGANGLAACAPPQIHLGDRLPGDCPEAAKIGTVEVETPLVDHPLPGSVYLATPHDNPSASLLAFYVAIDDPQTGVVGKLAGAASADPDSGRLRATLDDAPQLPVKDFHLSLFEGTASVLRTPTACGTYATASQLTPWSAPDSGPPATPRDAYALVRGPDGAGCATSEAQLPNAPNLTAGSTSPRAGAYAPFVLELRRGDGSQPFGAVAIDPPAGLAARLAGTATCPEEALTVASGRSGTAERDAPSCPPGSRVGAVEVGAGAGPAPYYVHGSAYLTGPYRGAPAGLALVVPALAGPFDLGTIVVRLALRVDPRSGRIGVESDPLPQILDGIPLDLRTLSLRLDRPGFALNPTSCQPSAVTGSVRSPLGSVAPVSERFQVGDCARLGFAPSLSLRLLGPTHRRANPRLRATVSGREGDANLRRLSLGLPATSLFDLEGLRGVCAATAELRACPRRSIYGWASASTPLLDEPLRGPVYLRAGSNRLPDLAVALGGRFQLQLRARVDAVGGRLRVAFQRLPDLPLGRFALTIDGGGRGLFANSGGVCRGERRARAHFLGHNGDVHRSRPLVKATCGGRPRSPN